MRVAVRAKRHLAVIVVALLAVSAFVVYAVLSFSPPGTPFPEEQLFLDHYAIEYASGQPNPTLLTLWIGNGGTESATLTSLAVVDAAGGSQVSFQLAGPSIPGLTPVSVTVDTGSSGFYFVAGHSYTITLVTARGTQYGQTIQYG